MYGHLSMTSGYRELHSVSLKISVQKNKNKNCAKRNFFEGFELVFEDENREAVWGFFIDCFLKTTGEVGIIF